MIGQRLGRRLGLAHAVAGPEVERPRGGHEVHLAFALPVPLAVPVKGEDAVAGERIHARELREVERADERELAAVRRRRPALASRQQRRAAEPRPCAVGARAEGDAVARVAEHHVDRLARDARWSAGRSAARHAAGRCSRRRRRGRRAASPRAAARSRSCLTVGSGFAAPGSSIRYQTNRPTRANAPAQRRALLICGDIRPCIGGMPPLLKVRRRTAPARSARPRRVRSRRAPAGASW